MPSSLRYIGDGAFDRCGSLSNIRLPEKLKFMRIKRFMDA